MITDRRFNIRMVVIIVAADLLFNAGGLWGYNELRKSGMARSAADREAVIRKDDEIARKLDAAWVQRLDLAAETEKACRQ